MATASTVSLGDPHKPGPDSLKAFEVVESELKKELVRIRRDHNRHESEYFAAVDHLGDTELTGFQANDFVLVRVATSAYGTHLLAKLRIPAMPEDGPAYVHCRIFVTGNDDEPAKLHSFHTEEKGEDGQDKTYRAIFTKDDPLEWFDT
jgi:hypothetical protein